LARQAQVGVGQMPMRFRSFESSAPGPLASADLWLAAEKSTETVNAEPDVLQLRFVASR
jgi:hypothetical protein